jgi:hypothetical protein
MESDTDRRMRIEEKERNYTERRTMLRWFLISSSVRPNLDPMQFSPAGNYCERKKPTR